MTQQSNETFPLKRPRRNRKSAALRLLVQETHLSPSDFVAPLFVVEGKNQQQPIASLPAVYRLSVDNLLKKVEELYGLGVRAIDLFPCIVKEKKEARGSEALKRDLFIYRAIEAIKREIPEMCVMVDIALDPFTDHGHDGVLNDKGEVDNDATLPLLAEMALRAAEAGADVVAPSDMMDGRVAYLRRALDKASFCSINILAYTAKYASSLYGPFREALGSALRSGDKKGYQMNPANRREALLEAALDEEEGADLLLVKPALPYLDVLSQIKAQTTLPVGAYHVSGEYAMVMAAASNGWLDGDAVMHECLLSIKRAGADFILTYAAEQMARRLC